MNNPFINNSAINHKTAYGRVISDNMPDGIWQDIGPTINQPMVTPHKYANHNAFYDNVIVYRAITLLSKAVSQVSWGVYRQDGDKISELNTHPLQLLLNTPSPKEAFSTLIRRIVQDLCLHGEAYMLMVKAENGILQELYRLPPSQIEIVTGTTLLPLAYRYFANNKRYEYWVDQYDGGCDLLQLKYHHPQNEWHGYAPIKAAELSIAQHNMAGMWNRALLENGARPSGALVMRNHGDAINNFLTEEQYQRLKAQIAENYSNPDNAGKPLILDGGMEWQEMSLSNKDIDFIAAKNMAAREIALAFGVPPQLLGIPGDNTYSNLAEARLALWEETVLPMLNQLRDEFNRWIAPIYGSKISINYDADSISSLGEKRQQVWDKLARCDFLTINEKREALGYGMVAGGDNL